MDEVVAELLRGGWQGVIAAAVLLAARGVAPSLAALFPSIVTARGKREDRRMEALEAATRVMAETVAALQSLRVEVGEIRQSYGDLSMDVAYVADQLELPRTKSRRAKGVTNGS